MSAKVYYTKVGKGEDVRGFNHPTERVIQDIAYKWGNRYTTAEVGDVRRFECPACGARAGESCITKQGMPSKTNHPKRYALAYWEAAGVAAEKYAREEWAHS